MFVMCLTGARLNRAGLTGVGLADAGVIGAGLIGAGLFGAGLTGVDLFGANAIESPSQDLYFVKIVDYARIDSGISKAMLDKMGSHLRARHG